MKRRMKEYGMMKTPPNQRRPRRATPERERWLLQTESFYATRGRCSSSSRDAGLGMRAARGVPDRPRPTWPPAFLWCRRPSPWGYPRTLAAGSSALGCPCLHSTRPRPRSAISSQRSIPGGPPLLSVQRVGVATSGRTRDHHQRVVRDAMRVASELIDIDSPPSRPAWQPAFEMRSWGLPAPK
jgi:hypothetical protein